MIYTTTYTLSISIVCLWIDILYHMDRHMHVCIYREHDHDARGLDDVPFSMLTYKGDKEEKNQMQGNYLSYSGIPSVFLT